MSTYAKAAQDIIQSNIYMTIATASSDGCPWISPVFFAYDHEYNLFWNSNKGSRHSTLIRNNPQIAIVIFDSTAAEGTADAVYIEAEAVELSQHEDLNLAIKTYASRAAFKEGIPKNIDEVSGDAIWRMYRATSKKIYKLGGHEYINGQYADKLIKISSLLN